MDHSADESLSKETLLEDQLSSSQPKHTRKCGLKKPIFFLLIIVLLISSSFLIYSIYRKNRAKKSNSLYLSRSRQYYCHLTAFRSLCYDSMPSVIDPAALRTGPGPLFSGSLRVAINQLTTTNDSITKALLSSPNTTSPLTESRLRACQVWVSDSLSRLNGSLALLGVDSDVEALTFGELDGIKSLSVAARNSVRNCVSGLEEIAGKIGRKEEDGVEEVKKGVVKARNLMINSVGYFDGRENILFDFYNPFDDNDENYYDNYFYYYNFEYRFLVCLYSVMYLFLALVYYLFWRGD